MADPTKFTPGYSYSDWQAENPRLPLPAPEVDDDFANIATSVNETIDALKEIRRSDGALNNQIVTLDTLAPEVRDQIGEGATDARDAAIEAAQQSAQSASASAASAGAAAGSAGTAATSAGQAMTFRNAAQTAQTGAQTAQTGAQAARDAARQWSSAPTGQIVDDGVNPAGYSAYHWAEVAEGAAGGNLPDGAVTTAKLADSAVTTPKIANNAITNDKVATPATPADAIPATKLAFTQAGAGAIARSIQSRMRDWVSVKDFGAVGNGTTDDTAAFKAARDFLQTNSDFRGGRIYIPAGTYRLTDEWVFTAYAAGVVHNIIVEGAGQQATVLDFSGTAAGKDGIQFGTGSHFAVKNLSIVGAKRYGIAVIGSLDGNSSCSYFEMADLRIQGCVSAGFYTAHSFLGTLRNVWTRSNDIGFLFSGFHTSINVSRCCASENTAAGYSINSMVYSSFVSCASDLNEWGYSLSNMNGVSFLGCGTEYNRREGYLVRASNALAAGLLVAVQDIRAVTLQNCFNLENATVSSGTTFVGATASDGRAIQLSLIGCSSFRQQTSHVSVTANAAAGVIRINEQFNSFDGGYFTAGAVTRVGMDFLALTAGAFSATGASIGKSMNRDTLSSSTTAAGTHFHAAFYNPNGLVGSISTNGSATAFTTSSDEEWKDFMGNFDPQEAIDIIRRDPVRNFRWKEEHGGQHAVGWGAQTSYEVSNDLAVPGGWFKHGEDGAMVACDRDAEGAFYQPWGVDQSKRTPYLWAAVSYLAGERDALAERVAALEEKLKEGRS